MKLKFWLGIFFGINFFSGPAFSHIDLLDPPSLMEARALGGVALKSPPFGAPGMDVTSAPAKTVKAGSILEIKLEVYVYHPGDIVVLYTTDPEGADIEPTWEIPEMGAEIPYTNLLHKGKVPDKNQGTFYTAQVPLPDFEGEIYLVVRQVMHDKFDINDDGTVSLARVYYHQATKLNLVK